MQKGPYDDIETLSFLTLKDRADLVLLMEGIIPSVRVEVLYDEQKYSSHKGFLDTVSMFEDVLKKRAIEYTKESDGDNQWICFYVAKSRAHVAELVDAYRLKPGNARDIAIGRALGYPESAIENYQLAFHQEFAKLPQSLQDNKDLVLLDFKLSKDNWKKELEFVSQKAQILRKHAPMLCKEMGIT